MDPELHWVKLSHQVSLGVSALHVIVFNEMKIHSHRMSKEEIISAMEDNSGETGVAKTKNMDEAIQLSSGEGVLEKFLNTAARVESIILFPKRLRDDSKLTVAAFLRNKMIFGPSL